jgi:hypothetical protein
VPAEHDVQTLAEIPENVPLAHEKHADDMLTDA